jgi:TolB-like protein/DNA-binding winged helix-turn-helix (wHTH) protein
MASLLRFGVFELDLKSGELRKEGALVRLPPQPWRLLALLAGQAGQVVARSEIQERLWSTGTFVDFDQGVNHCIRQVRTALGDEAGRPRYVQTLPRRGYRFLVSVEERPFPGPGPEAPGERADRLVLAVLPFDDLSSHPHDDHLSEALTDEVITRLGRLHPRRLGVVSRMSVRCFGSLGKTAAEAGRELGARYIVEGSVRRCGDRVRTCVQLVETRRQTHLWSETYEWPAGDLLAMQCEVAEAIAREVQLTLSFDLSWPPGASPAYGQPELAGALW